MTHTLHRQGTVESLSKDYVVLAISAKGYNSVGSGEKLKQVKQIMASHSPVNIGDIKIGNMFTHGIDAVVSHVQDGTVVHAVYRDLDSVSRVDRKSTRLNSSH